MGDPFGGGLGDLFDVFFNDMGGPGAGGRGRRSGPIPGPDAEMVLRLSFREAVFGVPRQVEVDAPVHCDSCEGSGAQPGTAAVRCPDCQGAGELRRMRQSILGQVITADLFRRIRATQLSFLQNMLGQGLLGSTDGSLPFSVICDTSNNPSSRTDLGYVQSDAQVQYQAINEKFIINMEGGQTVQVSRQTLPSGQAA